MGTDACGSNTTLSVSLPAELLDQIATYLGPKDVARARLSCISFCQSFTPYLVPLLTIKLSSRVTNIGPNKRRQGSFVPTPDTLVKFIKALHIEFNPLLLTLAGQSKCDELVNISRNEISRFSSLQSLTATCTRSSSLSELHTLYPLIANLEAALWDAIPDPARLQRLEMESFLFCSTSPTLLPRLACLKSFKVSNVFRCESNKSSIVDQVHNLLADSSTLTRLSFTIAGDSQKILLHDIFPSPLIRPYLPLQSLAFEGNCAWLPATKFQHMGPPYLPDLRQLMVSTSAGDADSDWDAFWNLLRETGTRLQDILVDHALTLSLVEYLASFEGLRLLLLLIPREQHINGIAEPLITRVLALHAPTLHKLVLYFPFMGIRTDLASERDSFTSTWPSPTCFLHLKYLCAWCPRWLSFGIDACQLLLDWLQQFPVLEHCIMVFHSALEDDSPGEGDLPDFRTIATALTVGNGRPGEWTLLYDPKLGLGECTLKLEQREDGTRHFIVAEEGYEIEWLPDRWK